MRREIFDANEAGRFAAACREYAMPRLNFLDLILAAWRRNPAPKKICMYGLKADPPHDGHLLCAEMVREAFGIDIVLFVTSGNPPHKDTGVTDAAIRHEMVKGAVAPNSHFEACDIEMKRSGKSYTYDTILALREKYGPEVELSLMMSSEYLDPDHPWYLKTKWDHSDELLKIVHLLVFMRPGHTIEQTRAWGALLPNARIDYLTFCPSPPISSTMIRDRVANGESIWYMVQPHTWRTIRRYGLYGCKEKPARTILGEYWRRLSSATRCFLSDY